MCRLSPAVATVAGLALLLSACKPAPSPDVAATVNGKPITYAELDKQYQIQFSNPATPPNEDQTQSQKLELLKSMIDAEIMLQRAEKLGLMAVEADVETKLNEMKAPYTQEAFQKQLADQKMTLDDLKTQLRRDLSIQKLLNKEITSNITITDADMAEFYKANKGRFNLPEPQIHMAQIVVTPFADSNVRNLKNSKAQNDQDAVKKIQMIEARLRQGEDFSMLAQNFTEDPNTVSSGGDLGFIPESSLEKASPDLRKLILSIQPGQHSAVVKTAEGYRIFKVFSREPAGQRELNDPRVQQEIRDTLQSRKDQLFKAAYFEVARNETKVENFLAVKVATAMAQKGK